MTSRSQAPNVSDVDAMPLSSFGPCVEGSLAANSFIQAAPATVEQTTEPRQNMHIVHLIKHCGYGNGNVHVAVDLACLQAQEGNRVTFVSCGGTFVPLLKQYGVEHMELRQEQSNPFGLLRAAWMLSRFVYRERPTVLHAHMMSSALVGYVASKLCGVPLITTVHNSFDKHSRLMKLGSKVVAVSYAERESLCKQGYLQAQVDVVRNAPDRSPRENFMRNANEIKLQKPCILAANGLHPRKGVADLIQAAATVLPSFPEWHLYIAGEGPDRAALEKQVESSNLADRVTFLGFVPSPRTLMSQADIFVLASYADPCSLAIGEARAAGCAIIATAVGGTPEMLDHGAAGRLVPPGSPDAIKQQLIELLDDTHTREALRQTARNGAEVFDVREAVRGYNRVYRSVQNA